VSAASSTPEPPASIVDHLRGPLDRARAGDPDALEEVRHALDAHPEVWRKAGDLAAHVEVAWLELLAGGDPTARECLARRLAEWKADLAGPAPTPMERLLVERAAACWLQVQHADAAAADVLGREYPRATGEYVGRRQDAAHRRYLSAIGALEVLRRALPQAARPVGGLTVYDGPPAAPGGAGAEYLPALQGATMRSATA
jgi:hypothetical protein